MPDSDKMLRVSKENPCPVCGKPDWCLVAEDGSAAICQRIEEGSVNQCGDAGYLHILVDRPKNQQHCSQRRSTVGQDDKPDRDFTVLQQQYSRQTKDEQVNGLSQQLGVSVQSLKRLNIGWDGESYCFPMSNAQGRIIGIRRRFPSGCKLSVTGSKTGLFIPTGLDSGKRLLMCEGTTDTAAALTLGFDAIGRPNCDSKIEMTAEAAKGRTDIVIIADADTPGRVGAEKLADVLAIHYPSVKVVCPPENTKDLRDWQRAGLTSEGLRRIIEVTEPIGITISFRV